MKIDKKARNIIIGVAAAAVMVVVMLILIPVEKHQQEIKEYGQLAVAAENDERARYIIDNIDLYSKELVNIYNQSSAENKEEYLDFVYNYAFNKDDYSKMTFTEEELTSETIPALYMGDFRWAYEKIGNNYIKKQGCVTVSLTMANLYLYNDGSLTPKIIADKAVELGALNLFGGVNSLDVKRLAESIGFGCEEYIYDPDVGGVGQPDIKLIRDIIDDGHVLVAGMVGDTFGGHAIIIRSCSEDGILYINDPASCENTEKEWKFDDLCSEMYYLWDLSAKY